MSMLMMKKDPATIIVAGLKGKDDEESGETSMDHVKLAAYEFVDKAGLHVDDMDAFIEAFRAFHHYVHEEDSEEDSEGEGY